MFFSFSQINAQGDVEPIAKDVIKAYKTKDVVLLKKYITGIVVYAINDSFFDSKDGKPLVSMAENWNGNIKEVRYEKGNMMGKEILLASVYFSDNENGKLNIVMLSSYDGSDWKAFAFGLMDVSKEEFEQGSLEIPSSDEAEEVEEEKTIGSINSGFSVEMGNGDTYKEPNIKKILELLKTLNDDNFFLILNSNNGFLQASTSEKGYVVQYSDDDGMFEAEEYFTLEMLNEIFTAYINNADWKAKAKWVVM